MATERQSPDAILELTNLSGAVTAIQDDPDTPDASWLTAISNNADSICRTSFPTPTGNPTVGADLQQFKIWVRKMGGTGTPQVRIELYENNVFLATLLADTGVTSTSGVLHSGTWNASLLGTADGSLVECRIYGTKSGGGPTARAAIEVGAVEWNVTYSAGVTEWLSGISNGEAVVSGAIKITKKLVGTTIGEAGVSGAIKVSKKLAGVSNGVASVSGVVKITKKLVGVSAGVSQVTGAIKRFRGLAGLSEGLATVTGNLTVIPGAAVEWLSGISSGICSVVGNLSAIRKLAGASIGVSSVTGNLSRTRGLAGISSGVATVQGSLSFTKYLAGISEGVTTIVARLRKKLVAPPGREVKSYEPAIPGELWW